MADQQDAVTRVQVVRSVAKIRPQDAATIHQRNPDYPAPRPLREGQCSGLHGINDRCDLQTGHKLPHEATVEPGRQVRWTHPYT